MRKVIEAAGFAQRNRNLVMLLESNLEKAYRQAVSDSAILNRRIGDNSCIQDNRYYSIISTDKLKYYQEIYTPFLGAYGVFAKKSAHIKTLENSSVILFGFDENDLEIRYVYEKETKAFLDDFMNGKFEYTVYSGSPYMKMGRMLKSRHGAIRGNDKKLFMADPTKYIKENIVDMHHYAKETEKIFASTPIKIHTRIHGDSMDGMLPLMYIVKESRILGQCPYNKSGGFYTGLDYYSEKSMPNIINSMGELKRLCGESINANVIDSGSISTKQCNI